MFTNGISAFSNPLSILTEALTEANEPSYVTLQKAFRGDRVAMRKIDQQEEKRQLQERLWHRSPHPAIGQTLDIFA
jgi:hypothetical protein